MLLKFHTCKRGSKKKLIKPADSEGLGFRRLSSVIQDRKKSIVDRLRDSSRLVCNAVSKMLEWDRLPRDSVRAVVLWGDSLLNKQRLAISACAPLQKSSTWAWTYPLLTSLLITPTC